MTSSPDGHANDQRWFRRSSFTVAVVGVGFAFGTTAIVLDVMDLIPSLLRSILIFIAVLCLSCPGLLNFFGPGQAQPTFWEARQARRRHPENE